MHSARQRKLWFILFAVAMLALVTGLVLYALRQNISLFYTPSELLDGKAPRSHLIRLGGMVVKGSILRSRDDLLSVQFKLTDYKSTVIVSYRGILPDLFREGQGIVAQGQLLDNEHFTAKEVLAKHDANYMPKEVKDALAKASKPGATKSL